MKTFKEFLFVGLLGAVILIPMTGAVCLLVYLAINTTGSFDLGKFGTAFYLSAAVTFLLTTCAKYVITYRKLKRYANSINVPLNYVEEAWWDLNYWDTHKKDMFDWDQKQFMEMIAASRVAEQLE